MKTEQNCVQIHFMIIWERERQYLLILRCWLILGEMWNSESQFWWSKNPSPLSVDVTEPGQLYDVKSIEDDSFLYILLSFWNPGSISPNFFAEQKSC